MVVDRTHNQNLRTNLSATEMKSDSDGITKSLCNKIVQISFDDLNEELIRSIRQLFLDGVAVAVAGSIQEKPPSILADHVKNSGGSEQASLIGFGFKTSIQQASYVNGASMHVLDYEPMWNPPNHQLSTCLPAILAIAEHLDIKGKEVATALLKGIEMMGRLREASQQLDVKYVTFHPPGLVGPLGSAVAAGHMFSLGPDKLMHAIAIASSRCGSLWGNIGSHTKSMHCGLACASGAEAALLADRGFTGNPDILEADRGYVDAYFGKDVFKFESLLQFGEPFRVTYPGYALKMFPSQYGTHYAISAAIKLHSKINDPKRIKHVRITVPDLAYIDRPKPNNGLAGKFSWQYTTACALLDGNVTLSSFTDKKRFSPDLEAMLDKIELDITEDIPCRIGDVSIAMEVRLDDGEILMEKDAVPRGTFGTPPIPIEEHLIKVRSCLRTRLTEIDVEKIVELGSHVEQLTGKDFKTIMKILRSE